MVAHDTRALPSRVPPALRPYPATLDKGAAATFCSAGFCSFWKPGLAHDWTGASPGIRDDSSTHGAQPSAARLSIAADEIVRLSYVLEMAARPHCEVEIRLPKGDSSHRKWMKACRSRQVSPTLPNGRRKGPGRRHSDWLLEFRLTSVIVVIDYVYSYTSHRLFHSHFSRALALRPHSNTLAIFRAVSLYRCNGTAAATPKPCQ